MNKRNLAIGIALVIVGYLLYVDPDIIVALLIPLVFGVLIMEAIMIPIKVLISTVFKIKSLPTPPKSVESIKSKQRKLEEVVV